MNPAVQIVGDTWRYWRAFLYYLRGGSVDGGGHFFDCGVSEGRRMRCHVFSMALAMRMWAAPHYRKASYAGDVLDNFRNVAVPGTGVALSCLAYNRVLTLAFLVAGYPCWCLVAALAHAFRLRRRLDARATADAYRVQLLAPRDWFSLWRLNSRLAAWHSLCTRENVAWDAPDTTGGWHDYAMENKWAFLAVTKTTPSEVVLRYLPSPISRSIRGLFGSFLETE